MRRTHDRFCQLAFWPTVEFDDSSTLALQGNCQFWSESDDYVVTTSWSNLRDAIQPHSVFDEPDFCSVWEAQSKALLLYEALNNESLTLSMTMLPKLGLQFGKTLLTLPFTLLRSHRNFVQSQSIPLSLTLVPFLQSRRQF